MAFCTMAGWGVVRGVVVAGNGRSSPNSYTYPANLPQVAEIKIPLLADVDQVGLLYYSIITRTHPNPNPINPPALIAGDKLAQVRHLIG